MTRAATIEPARITHRSHGVQSGVRSSKAKAHTPVAAAITAMTILGVRFSLRRHSSHSEIPTTAAIAGASSTV